MTEVYCEAIECKHNLYGECDRKILMLVDKEYKLEDGRIITVVHCDRYELDKRVKNVGVSKG